MEQGCTEAFLLAHGFTVELLGELASQLRGSSGSCWRPNPSHGTRRDIVDDDRNADSVVDRLEVLIEPLLRRLVVISCHHQQPDFSACRASSIASAVEFEPAPAITGTRPFACSTHHSTTCPCTSCDKVGLSPVVPTGTKPSVPSAICQSTRPRKAFSSSAPLPKGVTSAVNEPRKLVLAVMIRIL